MGCAGRPARGAGRREGGAAGAAVTGGANAVADAGHGPAVDRGRGRTAAVPGPDRAEFRARAWRGGADLREGHAREKPDAARGCDGCRVVWCGRGADGGGRRDT